jgi:hypothetical protein
MLNLTVNMVYINSLDKFYLRLTIILSSQLHSITSLVLSEQ